MAIEQEIVNLSPAKRRLYEALLENQRAPVPGPAAGLAPRDGEPCPLSFAQMRLHVQEATDPRNPAYNIATAVRLGRTIDARRLARGLQAVSRRHGTLRASFHMAGGVPVQIVEPLRQPAIPVIDLRDLADPERAHEVTRLAQSEARRGFDLAVGRLVRVSLVKVAADDDVVLLTLHHIVCDGWSVGVLVRELLAFYDSPADGEMTLPVPPVSYADYAVWEQDAWRKGAFTRAEEYWAAQLRDCTPAIDLRASRAPKVLSRRRGRRFRTSLGRSLSRDLGELSRTAGATSFMTVLAAFFAFLYRYTGQRDLLVGTIVANRDWPQIQGLVGMFANTLPLRATVGPQQTFSELLRDVRTTAIDGYAHQACPYQRMTELAASAGAAPRNLTRVLVEMDTTPRADLSRSGMSATLLDIDKGVTDFDLILQLWERDDLHPELACVASMSKAFPRGIEPISTNRHAHEPPTQASRGVIEGFFEYREDCFDAPTIARLDRHFRALLAAAVANPEATLQSLPLLSADERDQYAALLSGCHYDAVGTIHETFADCAGRMPDAVAVIGGSQHVTYGTLDRAANRLGRRLQQLGVVPESVVGICLDRTPHVAAAILGVLKAGGAYLPIDPETPPERTTWMLTHANAVALIASPGVVTRLRGVTTPVLAVDAELYACDDGTAPPRPAVTAANAAYVIFTSGSTGEPKGVVIPHLNVGRLFAGCAGLGLCAGDVLSVVHSFAFDFSVWELFGALLHGGKAVVIPREIARSSDALVAVLRREQVTVLSHTPAAFEQLPERAARELTALRLITFGGERLDARHVRRWLPAVPRNPARLVNLYGVTETTVHVTRTDVTPAGLEQGDVGAPLPHLCAYVVDAAGDLVAPDQDGELWVGGGGAARGYLGRPALTAERFVPDGFSGRAGERLYRTGDVARYHTDRALAYVGRADMQVKVRGYRIETGEVEAALSAQPEIRQVAVVAQPGAAGGKQLVAYAVGEPVPAPLLKERLRRWLPEYMVPARIVWLHKLPLTANGKVDRAALPAPVDAEGPTGDPPSTTMERMLHDIWSELLRRPTIGIDENFFELGGHSLLAIESMSRLRELLQIEVPLTVMFEGRQTIADVAAAVDEFCIASADPELVARLEREQSALGCERGA